MAKSTVMSHTQGKGAFDRQVSGKGAFDSQVITSKQSDDHSVIIGEDEELDKIELHDLP